MGQFSTKQKSCFSCETSFHDKTEQKTAENKCPIFTYTPQCIVIHIVIHIPEYPNLTYIPNNDDTLRPNPTKPKNFNSFGGTPFFVFIISL